MFEIKSTYKIDIDTPIISYNYQIIHFDEVPILYTGTNENGERVVGSLCAENDDGESFRYFHLIIKNIDYIRFIKNKISYRELFKTVRRIFVIDRDINDKIIDIYNIPLIEIPDDCLPSPNVFCPYGDIIFGSEFTISLKGQLADAHEALNNQVNIIAKNIAQIFATITDCVKIDGLNSEIHQLAYTPTSFGINFKIKFNSNDMFFNKESEKALNEYVTKTINYSLNHLPSEAKNLIEINLEDTNFKKEVSDSLKRAYQTLTQSFDNKTEERLLKNVKKIPFEFEKITDQIGQGFEYLEVKSRNINDNTESIVGLIDNKFSEELNEATEVIEGKENIIIDEFFKNYTIHVYHLNILTRKGNAHIENENEEKKKILDSPKIDIIGELELNGSEFISSMDKGSWITIRAKAKKINGRYKSLTIEFT